MAKADDTLQAAVRRYVAAIEAARGIGGTPPAEAPSSPPAPSPVPRAPSEGGR